MSRFFKSKFTWSVAFVFMVSYFIVAIPVHATTNQWQVITPSGSSGYTALAVTNNYVYVATTNGVYKSTDGVTFVPMNNGLGAHTNITSVIIGWSFNLSTGHYTVSSTSPVFVGTTDGGLFSSTIGGSASTTWTAISSTTGLTDTHILDIKTDQYQVINNGSFTDIYVATPSGIFISTTTGAYWKADNSGLSGQPTKLTTDWLNSKIYALTNANKIYASNLYSANGTYEQWTQAFDANGTTTNNISMVDPSGGVVWLATSKGIYKSDENGLNFASTSIGLPGTSVDNIVSDYIDSNLAYASVPGSGVYRTVNEAIANANPQIPEWLPINIGLSDMNITHVETDPASSTSIYAIGSSGVYKLTYSGSPLEGIDLTPPSAVTDLSVSASSTQSNSLVLTWTAPGGDGTYGTSTAYDLRYATSTINSGNFSSATPVIPEPTPWGAGHSEYYIFNNYQNNIPASSSIYFALKASDSAGNISTLSNVAEFSTSTVGGTVSGLSGGNLVLQNNGGDNLTVSANGSFTFATALYTGQSYSVSVLSSPTGNFCSTTNATGTMMNANITNISITCTSDSLPPTITSFSLPSTASTEDVSIISFTATDNYGVTGYFLSESSTTPLASVYNWNLYKPSDYLFESTGNHTLYAWAKDAAGNISTIASSSVMITLPNYTISGVVEGLVGGSLVLQDNGGDNLTVSSNGSFDFATQITEGDFYNITILTQPVGQNCSVEQGSGSAGDYGIYSDIEIACVIPSIDDFTIPSTANSLTVPINSFDVGFYYLQNDDIVGISGYLLTESSSQPSAGDAGWSLSPPLSYTFSSAGTKTLYAWAKNSIGNVSVSASSSVVITLPSSGSSPSSSGSSGGGGGGGGGGTVPLATPVIIATSTKISTSTSVVTIINPVTGLTKSINIIPSVYLNLVQGTQSSSVVTLQKYLIQEGYLAPGLSTGYYGKLTAAAVAKYQNAVATAPSVSIACPKGWTCTSPTTSSTLSITQFTRTLTIGSVGQDVQNLQIFLNAHGFIVASSGSGSPGNESTYFGPATRAAVVRFQNAYVTEVLAPYGLTNGTGYFGIGTMKEVNSLLVP